MTWHPDKFYTDAGKHDAEQKLKKINHARDVLKDHFAYGGHNVSGTCSCGAEGGQQYAQAPPGAGSSGPSPERSNSTRSAEPKNERPDNDTDNSRRRPDEQATHKAEQQAKAAHEQKTQNVFRREATQKDQAATFGSLIKTHLLMQESARKLWKTQGSLELVTNGQVLQDNILISSSIPRVRLVCCML